MMNKPSRITSVAFSVEGHQGQRSLLGRPSARWEARALYHMLGHDGNTVESARELIAVPPKIESVPRTCTKESPEDA